MTRNLRMFLAFLMVRALDSIADWQKYAPALNGLGLIFVGCFRVFLVALILVGGIGADAGAETARGKVDSLFRAAVEEVGKVPVKESLKAFQNVLKEDRKYAPAYYEIAKLYMSLNTPMDRQSARNALNTAIHLAPGKIAYQMKLAEFLGKQGFWYNSAQKYEEILNVDPDNAEAAFQAGYYAFERFIKYIDMQHLDVIAGIFNDPPTRHMLYWKQFGEKDREKAIQYLERSIKLNAKLRDAYYYLGVVYFESGNPEAMIDVSKRLLKEVPDEPDALLFCGLGYQVLGQEKTAYQFYNRAIVRMGPEERALMESVDLVAPKEGPESPAVDAGQNPKEAANQGGWRDTLELARFWRQRDPLFLTPFNERRMDHYGRVAYATLRFSRPSKGIPGWQTDMGKAYIKFGRPLYKSSVRPDVKTGVSSGPNVYPPPGSDAVQPLVKTWFYRGFSIAFRNWDGLDDWRFDATYHPGSTQPDGIYVFNHTSPQYVDPYRREKYRVPDQIAAFQDGDSIRVELAYVLPKENVSVSERDGAVALENGIFVFDKNWDEVYRNRSSFRLIWQGLTKSGSAVLDSLKENYRVFQTAFKLAPGTYHVVGEVMDRRRKSIGTFREQRSFGVQDSSLAMSDILLATQIEALKPFPESRKDLSVEANPLRTYARSEPAFIYLEMYNLRQDVYGRTKYQIAYQIGSAQQKEIDPWQFIAQRLPQGRGHVEVEEVHRRPTSEMGRERQENAKKQGSLLLAARDEKPDFFAPGHEEEVTSRVRYVFPKNDQLASQIKEMVRRGKGTETKVTAQYEGNRRDDFTYLQIDLSQVPAGIHKLTVMLTDLKTGRSVEREVLFRVLK